MKTRLILKAGQKGTKKLSEKYGEALVCVRFRYDAKTRQRLKTIELIVETRPWDPPEPKHTAEELVPLIIKASNLTLRAEVKAAGGRWDPVRQVWYVKYGRIAGTKLEKHIYVDDM